MKPEWIAAAVAAASLAFQLFNAWIGLRQKNEVLVAISKQRDWADSKFAIENTCKERASLLGERLSRAGA